MASKNELQLENSRLENLKVSLAQCSSYLANANNSLAKVKRSLDANYLVNDNPSRLSAKSDLLILEISKTSNYINNNAINSITARQSAIKQEIAEIEAEEERARQRAIEAERQAREAAQAAAQAAQNAKNSQTVATSTASTTKKASTSSPVVSKPAASKNRMVQVS